MRLILTGVTGAAGLQIYRAALTDPTVTQVTLLSRRAVPSWAQLPPNADAKTNLILQSDFKSYDPATVAQLAEHDALIWALGKSSVGMSEEAYTELTYDYTMTAARALKEAGAGTAEKPFRFVFISGNLADPTGTSSQMWARVKGRTERELEDLFKGTNITSQVFRPGYFFPSKKYPADRINQRPLRSRAFDAVFAPLLSVLAPSIYTPVEDFGRFAVELAKGRWPDQQVFENWDMRKLMKTLPPLEPARDEL